jgi:predicted transcriptional regulator
MKSRDLYIHEQRVVALRTYQSIAEEMGLSRQRIKQIVVDVSRHIRWMQSVNEPQKMCDLVLPRRIRNCLKNEGLFDLTFEEFIDYSKKKNLGNIPNLGKGSIALLELKLTEATNGH